MINTTNIAKSNLKHNKSKSILIIVTILLATTLLSSVGMVCVNWIEGNKQRTIEYSGNYHGALTQLDLKEYEIVNNHADVDEVGVVNGIGIKEYEDETKIGISYVDKNAAKFSNVNLIEGNLPIKENEIVLDDLALKKLGYKDKLGEKISLTYEDNAIKGEITKEFILTGITKVNDISKARKAFSAIISNDYMENTRDMSKEKFNVFIRVEGEENLSGEELGFKVTKIGNDLDLDKSRIKINEDYINALKPDQEVIMWGVAIALIVILSSILVIYNIFYVSIVTKVQEFGKLRAMGATKKQIKSIVLKEGLILSFVAIPLGVIIGYIISDVILAFILPKSEISKIPIGIGIMGISFITVFVSLIKPMKVASRVSIIDAIRYNGVEDIKSKSRKGYDFINIKRLSSANLSRNKKRTYVTILSLTLSGIIFVVVSTVLTSISAEKMTRNHFPYDIQISLDNYTYGEDDSPDTELNILQMNNPIGSEFVKELSNIDGIKNVSEYKDIKSEIKGYETEYKYYSISSMDESDIKDLEFYLVDGKLDIEKLKSGDEILIAYPDLAKETGIKVGEKITLVLYDGNQKIEKEFTIQAITSGPGTFMIHEKAFDKIVNNNTNTSLGIYVEDRKFEKVKSYLEELVKLNDYLNMDSIEEAMKSSEISIQVTKLLGYSMVIIIGVIGFMNLVNSMIISIITRKKELGMLQAIGLTNKQLVKMLNIEAMFYTSSMLLGSLIFGNILGYIAVVICRKTGMSYATYTFPIVPILIMIISIVVAQLILTSLISKNFNKESLVDRVRYSE